MVENFVPCQFTQLLLKALFQGKKLYIFDLMFPFRFYLIKPIFTKLCFLIPPPYLTSCVLTNMIYIEHNLLLGSERLSTALAELNRVLNLVPPSKTRTSAGSYNKCTLFTPWQTKDVDIHIKNRVRIFVDIENVVKIL